MKHQFKLLTAAAAFSLVACNQANNSVPAEKVSNDSSDNAKIGYVVGTQLGSQVFKVVPLQVGEGLSEDAVLQGLNDAIVANKDTSKKLMLSEEELQNIGGAYSQKARARFNSIQPDSATYAKLQAENRNVQQYLDSLMNSMPVAPEAPVTGKAVKISESSTPIEKFSYMFGVNFASQVVAYSNQIGLEVSADAVREGIVDGHRMAKDTTFKGIFSADTVAAVQKRMSDYMTAAREKQMAEAKAAEEKMKAEIAPLRGDTLADGMPAKMSAEVKVKGINVQTENLSAYIGKPLLVFYFSATCGHCKHAAPEIVAISEEFKAKGLSTVAVASGSGSMKQVRQFMEGAKIEFPVVQDEGRQFGELYSDGYVPKVYLVNPDGSYNLYKNFGNQKDELKADIAALLGGKNVEHKIDLPAPAEAPAPAAN